jgi:hypothetical protein
MNRSTATSRHAADYGISGNGLAKICDRLNVPYPPRGYWARKAAGQKVVQFRLPDPADNNARRSDNHANAAACTAISAAAGDCRPAHCRPRNSCVFVRSLETRSHATIAAEAFRPANPTVGS